MPLSPQAIKEFKAIYREDFGVVLADEEALALAASFFQLMQVIYRSLPGEHCQTTERVI